MTDRQLLIAGAAIALGLLSFIAIEPQSRDAFQIAPSANGAVWRLNTNTGEIKICHIQPLVQGLFDIQCEP